MKPGYGTLLGDNDGVAGLKLDVLRHILALTYFLVIERDAGFSRGALPENVDGLLFAKSRNPPARAIASSTVKELTTMYDPGLTTCPRMLNFWLLTCCTITVTSGSEM